MFPYKPPDIGDDVNDNNMNNDDCECPVEDETFIEMTVIPRHYTGLETHYAETPLSSVNPEDPPPHTYEAARITEGWEAGSRNPRSTEKVEPVADSVSMPEDAGGASGPSHTSSIDVPDERPPSPRAEDGRPPSPVEARDPLPPPQVTSISISTSTTNEKDASVSAAYLHMYRLFKLVIA